MKDILFEHRVFADGRINVNSQRMLKSRPQLLDDVIAFTSFLPAEVSLKERLGAIWQGITERPKCKICQSNVLFEERGRPRYLSVCSKGCKDRLRFLSTGEGGRKASAAKRHIKLAATDSAGVTGYQRMYLKSLTTKVKSGMYVPPSSKSALQRYRSECMKITKSNNLSLIENIDKRKSTGALGGYHLDHKVSISFGFKNNVDPKIIGHICNLEMIPWEENLKKNLNCSISVEQLRDQISKYQG